MDHITTTSITLKSQDPQSSVATNALLSGLKEVLVEQNSARQEQWLDLLQYILSSEAHAAMVTDCGDLFFLLACMVPKTLQSHVKLIKCVSHDRFTGEAIKIIKSSKCGIDGYLFWRAVDTICQASPLILSECYQELMVKIKVEIVVFVESFKLRDMPSRSMLESILSVLRSLLQQREVYSVAEAKTIASYLFALTEEIHRQFETLNENNEDIPLSYTPETGRSANSYGKESGIRYHAEFDVTGEQQDKRKEVVGHRVPESFPIGEDLQQESLSPLRFDAMMTSTPQYFQLNKQNIFNLRDWVEACLASASYVIITFVRHCSDIGEFDESVCVRQQRRPSKELPLKGSQEKKGERLLNLQDALGMLASGNDHLTIVGMTYVIKRLRVLSNKRSQHPSRGCDKSAKHVPGDILFKHQLQGSSKFSEEPTSSRRSSEGLPDSNDGMNSNSAESCANEAAVTGIGIASSTSVRGTKSNHLNHRTFERLESTDEVKREPTRRLSKDFLQEAESLINELIYTGSLRLMVIGFLSRQHLVRELAAESLQLIMEILPNNTNICVSFLEQGLVSTLELIRSGIPVHALQANALKGFDQQIRQHGLFDFSSEEWNKEHKVYMTKGDPEQKASLASEHDVNRNDCQMNYNDVVFPEKRIRDTAFTLLKALADTLNKSLIKIDADIKRSQDANSSGEGAAAHMKKRVGMKDKKAKIEPQKSQVDLDGTAVGRVFCSLSSNSNNAMKTNILSSLLALCGVKDTLGKRLWSYELPEMRAEAAFVPPTESNELIFVASHMPKSNLFMHLIRGLNDDAKAIIDVVIEPILHILSTAMEVVAMNTRNSRRQRVEKYHSKATLDLETQRQDVLMSTPSSSTVASTRTSLHLSALAVTVMIRREENLVKMQLPTFDVISLHSRHLADLLQHTLMAQVAASDQLYESALSNDDNDLNDDKDSGRSSHDSQSGEQKRRNSRRDSDADRLASAVKALDLQTEHFYELEGRFEIWQEICSQMTDDYLLKSSLLGMDVDMILAAYTVAQKYKMSILIDEYSQCLATRVNADTFMLIFECALGNIVRGNAYDTVGDLCLNAKAVAEQGLKPGPILYEALPPNLFLLIYCLTYLQINLSKMLTSKYIRIGKLSSMLCQCIKYIAV